MATIRRNGTDRGKTGRCLAGMLMAFLVLLPGISLNAQGDRKVELTAQEILARVDRVLDYPKGLLRGKMVHILPNGRTNAVNLTGFISDADYLFTFSTDDRGDQIKVLFNFRGEDIWVYNILSVKLFHKLGVDRYDSVLSTNFFYIDFSNADLQSNFTGKITGDALINGLECYRLTLLPIFKGGNYGMLTLYVHKKDYIPLKIDYHDNDMVIFKTLSISQTMEKGKKKFPIRYEMLDVRKGTITILNYHTLEENVSFDKKIFMHQSLGTKP